MRIPSAGESDTQGLGHRLGALLEPGDVIALSGELGAGKTVLARGIVEGSAAGGPVTSPTFTFIHAHRGRVPVYHVDLYRIDRTTQLDDLGLEDVLADRAIVIIEWAEKAGTYLAPEHLWITIGFGPSDNARVLDFRPKGSRYERLLTAFASASK